MAYRIVHTGPNTHEGGLQDGLINCAYCVDSFIILFIISVKFQIGMQIPILAESGRFELPKGFLPYHLSKVAH